MGLLAQVTRTIGSRLCQARWHGARGTCDAGACEWQLRRRCGRGPTVRPLRSGSCDLRWTCPTSRNSRTRRRSLPSPGTPRQPAGTGSSSGTTSTPSERCRVPMADPWVLLAAVAQATERIKLGTDGHARAAPAAVGAGSPDRDAGLPVGRPVDPGRGPRGAGRDRVHRVRRRSRHPRPRREAGRRPGHPGGPVERRAFRVRGPPLPRGSDEVPADADPAAAHPRLGRRDVAEGGAAAPGRGLGRLLPDEARAGRRAKRRR